jgi:hypothetical protein
MLQVLSFLRHAANSEFKQIDYNNLEHLKEK